MGVRNDFPVLAGFPTGPRTIFQRKNSLDEIFSQLALDDFPWKSELARKVLFWGEGAGGVSSYVAGWMAGQGIDVIVLDGANRFDPYLVSSFARKALIPPENLLRKILIARAFTCYQMATLVQEKLGPFLKEEREEGRLQKPWVILLGPITTFLDEDVSEREIRPLFERTLRSMDEMAAEKIPFFFFQPSGFSSPSPLHLFKGEKRTYLMRRLFQFSNEVWRISLEDREPQIVLEKSLIKNLGIGDLVAENWTRRTSDGANGSSF